MRFLNTLSQRTSRPPAPVPGSAAVGQAAPDTQLVRATIGASDSATAATLPSGCGPYRVYDAQRSDLPGGPARQPGVMPGRGYEALRTPFGETGVPGAGRECNVTSLDLRANRHVDGYPFAAANGRSTRQVPVTHRQPSAGSPISSEEGGHGTPSVS